MFFQKKVFIEFLTHGDFFKAFPGFGISQQSDITLKKITEESFFFKKIEKISEFFS